MAQKTVFWSWQSWVDQRATRNYIERALKDALGEIAAADLEVARRPEQDARGATGAVDISQEILAKIRSAAVVVADVTNVSTKRKDRLTPNPNVLFEVGFAEGILSDRRVILVANSRFGQPAAMPFDIRNRSILYYSDEGHESRGEGSRQLARALKIRIEEALAFATRPEPLSVELSRASGRRELTMGRDAFSYALRLENLTSGTLENLRICSVGWERSDKDKPIDGRLPQVLVDNVDVVKPDDPNNTSRLVVAWHDLERLKAHGDAEIEVACTRFAGHAWETRSALALISENRAPRLFQVMIKAKTGAAFEYSRNAARALHKEFLFWDVAITEAARLSVSFRQVPRA